MKRPNPDPKSSPQGEAVRGSQQFVSPPVVTPTVSTGQSFPGSSLPGRVGGSKAQLLPSHLGCFGAFKSNHSLWWLAAGSHQAQLLWAKVIQALIFAPEVSPDQGKPLSDSGAEAEAFYLTPPLPAQAVTPEVRKQEFMALKVQHWGNLSSPVGLQTFDALTEERGLIQKGKEEAGT